jgi:hypothetical protein
MKMKSEIKRTLVVLFIALFFVAKAEAASFAVAPAVIDEKGKARDIFKESVTIKNQAGFRTTLYAFVNNVLSQEGRIDFIDPATADQTKSLANWIDFPRMVEIGPGEEKKINFVVNVSLQAEPGIYHAIISLADGFTRDEAERKVKTSPYLAVNLEVANDRKEVLILKRFVPEKNFFFGTRASFLYDLENTGNTPLQPKGELRISNRRGEEVVSVPLGVDGKIIGPGNKAGFSGTWEGANGFGKYKALLNIRYGESDSGFLQDTVFFWIIPWWLLVLILGLMILMSVFVANAVHRRHKDRDHRHVAGPSPKRVIDLRRPESKRERK